MIIGVLRERKIGEHRVALTPSGALILQKNGHTVLVESKAGEGSGFSDTLYQEAGARMVTAKEAAKNADMLVKIKEPIHEEYRLLKMLEGKILFAYLHLSGVDKLLTKKLLKHHVTALAYETIEDRYGKHPLLAPMSRVAGVSAVQYAAEYLQKKHSGAGITLGRIPNTESAHVVIVGGGIAGEYAAKTVLGMGARVTVFEKHARRITELKKIFEDFGPYFKNKIQILEPKESDLCEKMRGAHVLIGAVLSSGARAECAVSKAHVMETAPGAVIVDISIDQGGCVWGSRPTTHEKPIFQHEGRIYCCVTNIPGQMPLQSTPALTAMTLPYILTIANNGIIMAFEKDKGLLRGINTWNGKITCEAVARDLDMQKEYLAPCDMLENALRKMITS